MEQNSAVRRCGECPLCRFTRNRKKDNILYRIARRVQKTCPFCVEANKAAHKDLQKSNYF